MKRGKNKRPVDPVGVHNDRGGKGEGRGKVRVIMEIKGKKGEMAAK